LTNALTTTLCAAVAATIFSFFVLRTYTVQIGRSALFHMEHRPLVFSIIWLHTSGFLKVLSSLVEPAFFVVEASHEKMPFRTPVLFSNQKPLYRFQLPAVEGRADHRIDASPGIGHVISNVKEFL